MSSGDLDRRLAALAEAVELADGRLDPERTEAARAVVRRAGQRLGLGVEVTVVALAGPTGAGKSSLFNALSAAELTSAGHRRPTTSASTAAIWGEVGDPLLDWLDVPRRHHLGERDGAGMVLLDLPDFDSVERSHRTEVERIIELADLVVWVVDPQKYADASLHERYLRPLSAYGESMLFVVNQADRLSSEAVEACQADLHRLLREDGLDGGRVLAVSALEGDGLPELQAVLEDVAEARGAAAARLATDVSSAAQGLGARCGEGRPEAIRQIDRERLSAALGEAAGVPTVVRAVARAHRRRGALATGWPFVRWIRRVRPDPLRRLHLGDGGDGAERTSLPAPSPLQRAQAGAATRALAAAASGALAPPWPTLVRTAATRDEERLPARLDRAVAGAELPTRRPLWWPLAGLLQVLLAAAAVVGLLWLLGLAVLGYLQLGDILPTPSIEGFAVPTVLLVGGALAGLLLALAFRVVNGFGARRRARKAARVLRARVADVGEEIVVAPVERELDAYARLCEALERAERTSRRLRLPGARRAAALLPGGSGASG